MLLLMLDVSLLLEQQHNANDDLKCEIMYT